MFTKNKTLKKKKKKYASFLPLFGFIQVFLKKAKLFFHIGQRCEECNITVRCNFAIASDFSARALPVHLRKMRGYLSNVRELPSRTVVLGTIVPIVDFPLYSLLVTTLILYLPLGKGLSTKHICSDHTATGSAIRPPPDVIQLWSWMRRHLHSKSMQRLNIKTYCMVSLDECFN